MLRLLSINNALRPRLQVAAPVSQNPPVPTLLPVDVPLEEERVPHYNPRKFYPVRVGEIFNNSYEVAFKVGYGVSSTVWFAKDIRRWRFQSPRYVALKICNSDHADKDSAEHESNICRHLATGSRWHPGRAYVRALLDSFEIKGLDGTHVCLVYEPMREPIWILQQRIGGIYPSDLLKKSLEYILQSLDYIHTECHIIHTDIKPENILVGFEKGPILENLILAEANEPSPRKVYEDRTIYLSRNDFGHFTSSPGRPTLADFGIAVRGDVSQPHTIPIQPSSYRAPEVTLGAPWSYSVDIWNLGVMIWDMLENKPLCPDVSQKLRYSSRVQVAEFIALLGNPPQELLDRGVFKSKDLIPKDFTLENSITTLEGEDKELFLDFARKMLQWLPEDRWSAKQLLEHPWLYKYTKTYTNP